VQHYIIGGHETKGLKRNFGFWILGFGLEEKSIRENYRNHKKQGAL
jgi:hypothetical protein